MTKHFKYGGSTAARTIGCAAWQQLAADAPKPVNGGSNPAADQGTMLHNCMERLYGPEYPSLEPEQLLEEKIHYNDEYLTKDLIDQKLMPAIEAVEDILDEFNIESWMLEPLVVIDAETGGSIDFLALSGDAKTVVVWDYKFGFNPVAADENSQLQFYGLASAIDQQTAHMFDGVEKIVYLIVQPNDNGEVVDRWESDLTGLDFFETKYFEAVDKSKEEDAIPTPGSHCRYCPVEATCPAKTGAALKATRVNEITAAKLSEYLPLADEVVAWAKAVQKMAHEQLELGVPIDGYKLVAKRASRVWTDKAAAEDKVKKARKIKIADAYDMKLKSPAQLEKKCKELKIDFKPYTAYIDSVSSGSTLAKQSDKRPALLPVQGLAQLNALND